MSFHLEEASKEVPVKAHGVTSPFTVHHFLSEQQTPPLRRDALREGERAILSATVNNEQWVQRRNVTTQVHGTPPVVEGRSYCYNVPAPVVARTSVNIIALKEWGEPVTSDEIYCLDDLEEFQCGISAVAQTRNSPTVSAGTDTLAIKRVRETGQEGAPGGPPSKRQRSAENSLSHLIPKPHVYPSPYVPYPIAMMPAARYWKAQPTYIAPYDADQLSSIPDTARFTWIIPVRGTLPWGGSTPASITLDAQPPKSQAIQWTPDSLLQFWEYLVNFHLGGKFGSFGISFHAARTKNSRTGVARMRRAKLSTTLSAQMQTGKDTPISLAAIDHIKLYHDAFARLQLRSILDAFVYKGNVEEGQDHVLKGARLVLLDNCGRGVMIL